MLNIRLFILSSFFVLFAYDLNAETLSPNQQRELISSLNYLQYSTARIKMSENKAIAEDIYYSIINELKIEAISDRDLNFEYGEFLAKCANLKLTQNEKDFIKQLNEKAQKNAYLSAFSNIGSVFVPGQSPHQMVASLVYTTVSNAFAVANTKNQLQTQLEKDMFNLDQRIMKDIFDMQTSLFTTSAKLLGNASSSGLITENTMNIFMKSIKLSTAKERKNALSEHQLQENLFQFPPYWFELGNAFLEMGDTAKALRAYDHFVEIKKNDIVLRDKNYVELIKSKIQILLGSNPEEVIANAITNKDEILRYIEILKSNYLDSEAGDKNLYLAKIYYLLGSTEESLNCLNYIIDAKSVYPNLVDEAVSLKLLIKSSLDNNEAALYQDAFNYSKVYFGDTNVDYSNLPVRKGWLGRFWDSIITFFKNIFSISDNEENQNKVEIDKDNICIRVPQAILDNYDVHFSIDNILYIPIVFKQDSTSMSLCFIDYDYDDIEEECLITMFCKSKMDHHDIVAKYSMQPIKKKIILAAEKAYKRVGSDIISRNAQTAVEFGQAIVDYDYEVDDEEELNEDIREEIEDEGKDNNWTKEEINSRVTQELTAKLAPDLKYLQERMYAAEKSHYTENNILFNPQLVAYDENYYLVGVKSIYNSKTDKEYSIDVSGNICYSKKSVNKKVTQDINRIEQAAYGGDIKSMVSLGVAYIEGYNTPKNPKDGIIWLLYAVHSDKKNLSKNKMEIAQAYKYLGECYWNGNGVIKDRAQARKWFRKSKDFGFDIDEEYLE